MVVTLNDDMGLEREVDIMGVRSYPKHDAIMTSKGQITIPVEVRQALQVKYGDRVEFVQIEPGRSEIVAATRPVIDLKGLIGLPSKGRFDRRHEQGDCGARGVGSMVGLGTNVFVRYFMQDDRKQSAKTNADHDTLEQWLQPHRRRQPNELLC